MCRSPFALIAVSLLIAISTAATAGTVGFDLHEPEISQAIDMLEAGQAKEALALLTDADKNSSGQTDRHRALQIGMAIIELRSGNESKARSILVPISKLDDAPAVAFPATALLDVAKRLPKAGKNDKDALANGAEWATLLSQTFDDCAQKCEAADNELIDVCKKQQWQKIDGHLSKCCEFRERALAIALDDIEPKRLTFVKQHRERLQRAIDAGNLGVKEKNTDAKVANTERKRSRRYSDERKAAKQENKAARETARDASEEIHAIIQERDDLDVRFAQKGPKGRKGRK